MFTCNFDSILQAFLSITIFYQFLSIVTWFEVFQAIIWFQVSDKDIAQSAGDIKCADSIPVEG